MPVDKNGCPAIGARCFVIGVCIDDTVSGDCPVVRSAYHEECSLGKTCRRERATMV